VATSWAGYPAPAVLGAVVVLLALKGWASAVLLLGLVLLAVLLVMSRSVRTVVLVLLVAALTGALWWWGGQWRDGVVAGTGLALLVGAWDSLRDVAASRDPSQDHRTLAHLTRVPAGVWLASWFLVDAVATGVIVALVLREVLALFHRWPIVPHARPSARSPRDRTSGQRPSRWGPCVKYSPT